MGQVSLGFYVFLHINWEKGVVNSFITKFTCCSGQIGVLNCSSGSLTTSTLLSDVGGALIIHGFFSITLSLVVMATYTYFDFMEYAITSVLAFFRICIILFNTPHLLFTTCLDWMVFFVLPLDVFTLAVELLLLLVDPLPTKKPVYLIHFLKKRNALTIVHIPNSS